MAPEALAQVLGGLHLKPHPDLIVGFEGGEDAGVLRIAPDRALVFTTDFFPPMVDDPRAFGRIAAANALSDVFAMGGRPLAGLNLLAVPPSFDQDMLREILIGGAETLEAAGGVLAGGHTVEDKHELKYGLAVTGEVHPDKVIRNRGLRDGDVLVLTKPLGTGLITSSIKVKRNTGDEVTEAIRWMTTLNDTALDQILLAGPHAMTDITGFGFLGHLGEMLAKDPFEVRIRYSDLPLIPGVERCFKKEFKTRGGPTNRRYVGSRLITPEPLGPWDEEILFDPQTSGGLLMSLTADAANELLPKLHAAGLVHARIVGTVTSSEVPRIVVTP